jgi:3-oxoacyl-[acyl-carrier-protein] synthase-3
MPPLRLGPIDDVGILGAGTAFPEDELSNRDVLLALPPEVWGRRGPPDGDQLDFLASGMTETMGVERRAWAHRVGKPLDPASEESSLELAIAAARRALEAAGLVPGDAGIVLCATSTPHRMTSSLAAPLSAALGIRGACVDLRGGCSTGLFGLGTAATMLAASQGPALIVGADTFSKVIPPQSKVAALSLADGAGALVLGPKKGARLESLFFETDGTLGNLLTANGALPPTVEEIGRGGYFLGGSPDEFVQVVPQKYLAAIKGALEHAKLSVEAITHYVPHQPGLQVIHWVCQELGISQSKSFVNVHRHANVGAGGWLVALAEAQAERSFQPGDLILTAAVGGGMSYGAAVLRWA